MVGGIDERIYMLKYGRYIGTTTREMNMVEMPVTAERNAVIKPPRFFFVAATNKIEVEICKSSLREKINGSTDNTLLASAHKVAHHSHSWSAMGNTRLWRVDFGEIFCR